MPLGCVAAGRRRGDRDATRGGASRSSGANSFVRAAASSIASGSPSSRAHSSHDLARIRVDLDAEPARALCEQLRSDLWVERLECDLDLAGQMEPLAARHEHDQVRAPAQQRRERRRSADHLLEVVEHEQEPLRRRRARPGRRLRRSSRRSRAARARAPAAPRARRTTRRPGTSRARSRPPGSQAASSPSRPARSAVTRRAPSPPSSRASRSTILLASEQRRRRHRQSHGRRDRRGRGERVVLVQDRAVQRLQLRARVDPELVDESAARAAAYASSASAWRPAR